ncbi:MAG: hypothetical protein FWC16_04345 [Defluviitaleaceae bacterium]|nr:hypothetical protein [Defluviitaleaceae bacterium]MCL2274137.1 hypothetical protein [Defluviitaleaceae bacterium]
MDSLLETAHACVETHAKQALAVSFIPLVSAPIVYGVCAKMIKQLDEIFGIPTATGWDSEITHDIMAGIIAAPVLAIPLLGAGAASVFIKSIGMNYVNAVAEMLRTASEEERKDIAFISRRVKEELQKLHEEKRKKRRARG